MKILFYGFRHNHIRALYKKALASPQFEIAGCIEPDDAAREAVSLIENDTNMAGEMMLDVDKKSVSETLKYATIVFATVPILIVYPFLQKYFTKGVMVGAVKG